MRLAKVVALGELLIDFTPSGKSERGRPVYECNPGGAPANMLCCLGQFGHECAMIACVGEDAFGAEIVDALETSGIDCRYVKRSHTAPTTLAVVSLDAQGDRSFSFYRENCADVSVAPQDITAQMLSGVSLVHVGSLSLTHEPVRSATKTLLAMAKEAGVAISYDPNYRAMLWKSEEQAREQMRSILPLADVVKVSEEEVTFLTGLDDIDQGAHAILDAHANIRVLFVTCGAQGSAYYTREGCGRQPSFSGEPIIDTTGAGDYFFGGALSQLLEEGLDQPIGVKCAQRACERGNLCGYRVALVRGALGVKVV